MFYDMQPFPFESAKLLPVTQQIAAGNSTSPNIYSRTPLLRPPLLIQKSGLSRGVASHQG